MLSRAGTCQLLLGVREGKCVLKLPRQPQVWGRDFCLSFSLQNVYSVHSTVKEAREVCLA